MKVIESKRVAEWLEKHNLLDQYVEAKLFIESGFYQNVDFRIRKPKKDKIYYFKINDQYRAVCVFRSEKLIQVYDYDDHQNKKKNKKPPVWE